MKRSRRTISAAEFKARCLALLDEVGESKETLVVTKRGRPVARLVAAERGRGGSLRGSVEVRGDIVGPLDERWDAER